MTMINALKVTFFFIWTSLFVIAGGCGGNGSSSSPTIVSGVAAVGSPLAGTAYLKDSSNPPRELSISLEEDGSFFFNTDGLTAPFILKAVGTADTTFTTLYSYSPAAGIANINPLSHLAVVEAYGSTELETLYAMPNATGMQIISAGLRDAVSRVLTVLQPTLAKLDIASTNFITNPFVANHQGFDLLLDLVSVSTDNGTVTIRDKAAGTTTDIPLDDFRNRLIDAVPLTTDTPGSVNIWPATSTLSVGKTQDFLSLLVKSATQQVSWSVDETNGGTITSSGRYTAPETAGTYHIRATSIADQTKSAVAAVTVTDTNLLKLVHAGGGVFVLTGENLVDIEGISATIFYNNSVLRNPTVQRGTLGPGSMAVANTSTPGRISLAYLNKTSFSGTTTLGTITFEVLSPEPETGIVSMSSKFVQKMPGGGFQDVTPAQYPPNDSSTPDSTSDSQSPSSAASGSQIANAAPNQY